MELPNELFVQCPQHRWENTLGWLAKQGKKPGITKDIIGSEFERSWPTYTGQKPHGRGAANAWLLVIGPGPGDNPSDEAEMDEIRQSPFHLTLGAGHPYFSKYCDKKRFWEHEMGPKGREKQAHHVQSTKTETGFVPAFFKAFEIGERAALGLTFHTNLAIRQSGTELNLSKSELIAGLERTLRILDLTGARCILTLSSQVFKIIQGGLLAHKGIPNRRPFARAYEGIPYHSLWQTWQFEPQGRIILEKTPQHFSRWGLWHGVIDTSGEDLGRIAKDELGC